MATSRTQRTVIWIIAITMTVGTIGAYLAIILSSRTGQTDATVQKQLDDAQAQKKQQEEAIKQLARDNQPLEGYTAESFASSSVTELQITDLKLGEGDAVQTGAKVKVSYFGWTPDGTIFDSTTKKGTNTPTASAFELKEGSLIKGWVNGIPGMRVGGERKLLIPAADAYGSEGSPPLIAADTPLAFIVRIESID